MVVGRWTAREIRALREALRMSVRAFAEHLGLAVAAVTAWEHRTTPATPTLAAQSVLDQALTLADTNSKARFQLLLANPDGPARQRDGRVTVDGPATALTNRQVGVRPAS
ncbi:hypothetical protein EDC02_6687 [Micromonospora sp. Llam0]|nr:hypothetical protein EDC02_6687 [Micromonospora sp. Llam0]